MTAEHLVEAVLAGDVAAAEHSVRQGVVAAVAAGVHARLASPRSDGDGAWWTAQRAVMAVGGVVEAGERELAKALLDAVVAGGARPQTLDVQVAAWLVEQCPQAVGAHLGRGVRGDLVNLAESVFMLPGQVGAEWFMVLVRAGWGLRMMADMREVAAPEGHRSGRVRWQHGWLWSEGDWTTKLDALAVARLPVAPRVLFGLALWTSPVLPPHGACAAQIRCGLVYGHGALAGLLDVCATHLAARRTGEPDHDAPLIWWTCHSQDELERLGEILAAAGPRTWRAEVVGRAVAGGLIPEDHASFLLQHADLAALDAAGWHVERLEEITELPIGAGGLWLGDLFAGDGATGATVPLAGANAAVWGVVAGHPRYPNSSIQALDVMTAVDPIAAWEPLAIGEDTGLRCEASRITLGAGGVPDVFRGYPFAAELLRDLALHMPAPSTTDTPAGPAISLDLPAPQRPVRAWSGRRADGDIIRVVIDLGLDLDPTGTSLPWDLAPIPSR